MSAEHVGWWIVAAFVSVIVGCTIFLRRTHDQISEAENMLVLYMFYNILFVTLIGNTMDIGENNRFRYVIDPFLVILFVFFLRNVIIQFRKPKQIDPLEQD